MLMRLLTVSFLRLFALNLGRSFRNTPDKAFDDAVMQLSTVMIIPLVLIAFKIWRLIPWVLRGPSSATIFFLVTGMVLVFPLQSWLDRRFATFRQQPEAAAPYRRDTEPIKTVLGFLLSMLIVICVTVSVA